MLRFLGSKILQKFLDLHKKVCVCGSVCIKLNLSLAVIFFIEILIFLDKIYGWEQIMWQPWFARVTRFQVCEQFKVTQNCIEVCWLNAMMPLLTLVREWLCVTTVVCNCIGHFNPFQCLVSSFAFISCSSCACESWLKNTLWCGEICKCTWRIKTN